MITTHDSLTAIAAAVAVFAIILFGIAVRGARHARRAAYYVTRRQSQDTANRQFLWAMLLLFIAVGVFIASRIIPQEPQPGDRVAPGLPAQETTPTPAIITTILPRLDPAPTAEQMQSTQPPAADVSPASAPANTTPTDTGEPRPPEQSPSPEPSPLPPEATAVITDVPLAAETETATPAPAASNKYFVLRAIASGVDPSGLPVNPSLQFEAGTPSIYIFFDFQNMPEGRRLRHNWFRDGGSVYFESMPWERSGSGNAAIDWSPSKGFDPGVYEVRVFLDDQLQFVANFEVK